MKLSKADMLMVLSCEAPWAFDAKDDVVTRTAERDAKVNVKRSWCEWIVERSEL